MKTPLLTLLLALLLTVITSSGQGEKWTAPYIGEWSNGRGEVLIITSSTVKFEDQKAMPYKDITKASDGESFILLISSPKGFFSKYLGLTVKSKEEMHSETFANIEDQGDNNIAEHNWFRDK